MYHTVKRIIPRPVKSFLKRQLLGQPISQNLDEDEAKVAAAVIEADIAKLSPGPRVAPQAWTQADAHAEAEGASQRFANFLNRYAGLKATNGAEARALQERHPIMTGMCDQLEQYLRMCDSVTSQAGSVLRRMCYFSVPFLNSKNACITYSYKSLLPRVGLLVHVNDEPRNFLVDALQGEYAVELVDNQSIVERTWKDRPYSHLAALRAKVREAVNQMPREFLEQFSSQEWLVEQATYQAQAQIGLQKLVEANTWDIIIIGAISTPLSMSLLEMPPEKRPTIVYLNHGQPMGDPMSDLFFKADYVLVRGKNDAAYYREAGYPDERIIKVGSLQDEDFPSLAALKQARTVGRARCRIDEGRPVLVYGLTYDLFAYKIKPVDEIFNLMMDSFIRLTSEHGVKNPVLYLKFHPAPTSDPNFSFSRMQYPLEKFRRLTEHGYSIRLATTLDDCLPAADCFITHDSTVIVDALSFGVPTLSLRIQQQPWRPLLGEAAYVEPTAHSFMSIHDRAEDVASSLAKLLNTDKSLAHSSSERTWRELFECGRTEGLMRTGALIKELLASANQM